MKVRKKQMNQQKGFEIACGDSRLFDAAIKPGKPKGHITSRCRALKRLRLSKPGSSRVTSNSFKRSSRVKTCKICDRVDFCLKKCSQMLFLTTCGCVRVRTKVQAPKTMLIRGYAACGLLSASVPFDKSCCLLFQCLLHI